MKPTIVRNISRADAGVIEKLGAHGVATVHEAQGRSGLLRPYMRPIYPTARARGQRRHDFLPGRRQPDDPRGDRGCRPGDVLVVTTTSESTDGMFGELLAVSCRAHGVVGLLIDAGVRDVADLTTMEFPVWAKAIHAQGTVKATAGSVNVPVVCAGAPRSPRATSIIGDVDGVVVVPKGKAAEVAKAGADRIAKEEKSGHDAEKRGARSRLLRAPGEAGRTRCPVR